VIVSYVYIYFILFLLFLLWKVNKLTTFNTVPQLCWGTVLNIGTSFIFLLFLLYIMLLQHTFLFCASLAPSRPHIMLSFCHVEHSRDIGSSLFCTALDRYALASFFASSKQWIVAVVVPNRPATGKLHPVLLASHNRAIDHILALILVRRLRLANLLPNTSAYLDPFHKHISSIHPNAAFVATKAFMFSNRR